MLDAVQRHMSCSLAASCRNNMNHSVFKKFFTLARTEILTPTVFRIILEASKIARALFVIKLYTWKGLVCLVITL